MEPLPVAAVPGTIDRERSLLSALGGVARALGQYSSERQNYGHLPDQVQQWLQQAPEPPAELIDHLFCLLSAKSDPLALLYERIVASPRRRRLGTFFTPTPVLEYIKDIIDLRLPTLPRSVADPGAGVGAFTTSALSWWPEASVHSIDVNLVTLGLLATRPDLNVGLSKARIRVRQEDFLTWLETDWPRLRGPRLILGNPPYTRHQQLTDSQKRAAQRAAGDIAPGLRAGLSTYFLAASLKSLRPKDSVCLLLPVNWLEADYAKPVRNYLWRTLKRRVELHLFPNHLEVFPGAQVAAMVIFVGPVSSDEQPLTIHQVTGHSSEGFASSVDFHVKRKDAPLPAFTVEAFTRNTRPRGSDSTSIPLAQLAHIRRGVATGANHFFLRTAAEKDALPPGSCVRAVSRLRDLGTEDLGETEHDRLGKEGVRCWLLNLTAEDVRNEAIRRLLDRGEIDKINERHLCKIRSPWYAIEKIVAPDILIGPMGKDRFRVVINSVKAIPTNTLYGLRLRDAKDTGSVARLATWLSGPEGQAALRSVARQHGDGLLKLEPGPLGSVAVPSYVLKSSHHG
ncbi:Eco57I restriction-modification methylase domain-containing protein [Streptomyces albogriseolus]|uniref:Eco57I restriction-modification methylase domain-containing protein n=1 Tax=Streptomyces albogriseolus TaxID=1887 RepID=UPI00369D452A